MIDTDSAWMLQQHESWNRQSFQKMPNFVSKTRHRYKFTPEQLAVAVRSAEIRQEMKESK